MLSLLKILCLIFKGWLFDKFDVKPFLKDENPIKSISTGGNILKIFNLTRPNSYHSLIPINCLKLNIIVNYEID